MRKIFTNKMWFIALLLVVSLTGCGGDNNGGILFLPAKGVCVGANCVPLGQAGDLAAAAGYAILTKAGVTNVQPDSLTLVVGNIGVSPIDSTAMTGWALVGVPVDDPSFTSVYVDAPFKLYAANNAEPTPTHLIAAILSMEAAYNNARDRQHSRPDADYLNIGTPTPGTLTDLTLRPGVYEWGSNVTIPTDLTLRGSAAGVWIFKISGTLVMSANKKIILTGGARPQNIFWQVAGTVEIGAGAEFKGIVLSADEVSVVTGASINGRLMTVKSVALDSNKVTQP